MKTRIRRRKVKDSLRMLCLVWKMINLIQKRREVRIVKWVWDCFLGVSSLISSINNNNKRERNNKNKNKKNKNKNTHLNKSHNQNIKDHLPSQPYPPCYPTTSNKSPFKPHSQPAPQSSYLHPVLPNTYHIWGGLNNCNNRYRNGSQVTIMVGDPSWYAVCCIITCIFKIWSFICLLGLRYLWFLGLSMNIWGFLWGIYVMSYILIYGRK